MPLYQQGGLTSSKSSLQGVPDAVKAFLIERMKGKAFGENQRQFNLNQALAESQMAQRGEMHDEEMAHKATMLQDYYKPMVAARQTAASQVSPVNWQRVKMIGPDGALYWGNYNPQTREYDRTNERAPEDPLTPYIRQAVGGMDLEGALTPNSPDQTPTPNSPGQTTNASQTTKGRPVLGRKAPPMHPVLGQSNFQTDPVAILDQWMKTQSNLTSMPADLVTDLQAGLRAVGQGADRQTVFQRILDEYNTEDYLKGRPLDERKSLKEFYATLLDPLTK